MDHLRLGVQDHPGQHGETLSLLKIPKTNKQTKTTECDGVWCMPVIIATWEPEAGELLQPGGEGCSELKSHHCTPAWETERDVV